MLPLATVFVTGSSGRLGQEIVRLLRAKGYRVIGADLLPADTTDLLLDIRDAQAVSRALRGADAVIHTAALHGRHYELGVARLEFVRTNIEGTLHLLNACRQHGIGKFLYTSTTSIYGQAMVHPTQAVWVDEDLRPEPRDIYDITKQAAEALCQDFFVQEGLETVVLRVGRFLPEPANLAANHRLYRGLDERDGALGHLLALEHRFTTFETFNITGSSPFQREDVGLLKQQPAQVIAQRLPMAPAAYQRLGWQFPTTIDRVYSSEKARRVLGYQPHYTAERLLQQALAAL
ncbi:Nucleoside-diphosphate-sugar epimerase [Hymenobacter daecheongensis DSM 21074]|uniref:Nucleoside-diphosphate-sugar epimerase n=1 Tax=Hymenobacter daecheongensis DSM 21074 TaxID=1121955 RepID=A0A1M6HKM7_9BACT|nr:NAD(P)-dependent oxidoreductase [Hymenobacter daecheongensis]SHJ22736.1 Nucleoside-diphosphate-sugar epimerase [Hymenobacter daecheongensis DSM 21074]